MTLKVKLVSAIAAFMMVLGIFIVAVLAASNASVNLSGSLSFQANDVVARVTGSATGAQINPQNLDVTYSSRDTVGNETVWHDLALNFIDHRTAIVFSFTVENLSTERSLTLTFTDNLAANANIEKEVLRDGGTYTSGAQIELDPMAEGITTNKTSFTVEFRVADGDTSFSGVTFDYVLNLYDESAVPFDYTGFSFETSGNEATLTSYTGTAEHVVIPSSFSIVDGEYVNGNDYTVTAIADGNISAQYAPFLGASKMKTIELPNTLKRIGDFAFVQSGLTSITFPDGLESIGEATFIGARLTSITFSDGLESIGDGAFYSCMNLSGDIVLPDTLTSIGNGAFTMTSITGVDIPASLTDIPSVDLELQSSGTIDGNNMYIAMGAFSMAPEMQRITVADDNSVYYSANNAVIERATKTLVLGCNSTTLPNDGSVTGIGVGAFIFQTFTSIDIPDAITSIGEGAFFSCMYLTSINFAEDSQLETIGSYAFSGCARLQSITIPASVTSIGEAVMNGLDIAITIAEGNSSYVVENDVLFDAGKTKLLYYRPSKTNASYEIPSTVTAIGAYAFQGADNLHSIVVPYGVTTIGNRAFQHSGIVSMDISSENTSYSFENGALYDKDKTVLLYYNTNTPDASLEIPNTVKRIVTDAFYEVHELEFIIIPASVEVIEDRAFLNTMPSTVTIDSQAVVEMLTHAEGAGWLLMYGFSGETVYITDGIVSSLPEYFLSRYTQQPESDKVGYTMYTKK